MAIKITKSQKKVSEKKPVNATTKPIKNCSTSNISANPQQIQGDEEFCPNCGNLICDCTCSAEAGDCVADAVEYVKSAISVLSLCAKDNDEIKDTIANLGVVLLDLSCIGETTCEPEIEDISDLPVEEPITEDISTL